MSKKGFSHWFKVNLIELVIELFVKHYINFNFAEEILKTKIYFLNTTIEIFKFNSLYVKLYIFSFNYNKQIRVVEVLLKGLS